MTGAVIVAVAVLALIPAYLAARKRTTNRNEIFVTYYLFGVVVLVLAIPAAIWAAKDERRRCPACAERVRPEAVKCPHCHVTIGDQSLEAQERGTIFDGV